MKNFTYEEMIKRNIGFISEEEQAQLRQSKVLVVGTGGMGGIALECLVRCGVSEFIISDIDHFEVSNLNRQIFSLLPNIGKDKVAVAKERILNINPECRVQVVQETLNYVKHVDLIINGCDDTRLTIELMREAQINNKTVIDAFASTLPSVYVVRPLDPRPEEFLGYSTWNKSKEEWSEDMILQCKEAEMIYVLAHSSTMKHVILKYALEMLRGERQRISFAPMVWSTGIMMSYEAVKVLLNKKTLASYRGIFMNPWTFQFEKPSFWGALKKIFIRQFIAKQKRKHL